LTITLVSALGGGDGAVTLRLALVDILMPSFTTISLGEATRSDTSVLILTLSFTVIFNSLAPDGATDFFWIDK